MQVLKRNKQENKTTFSLRKGIFKRKQETGTERKFVLSRQAFLENIQTTRALKKKLSNLVKRTKHFKSTGVYALHNEEF